MTRAEPLPYAPIEMREPTRATRPPCGHCGRKGMVTALMGERGQWTWYALCCGWESATYQRPVGG